MTDHNELADRLLTQCLPHAECKHCRKELEEAAAALRQKAEVPEDVEYIISLLIASADDCMGAEPDDRAGYREAANLIRTLSAAKEAAERERDDLRDRLNVTLDSAVDRIEKDGNRYLAVIRERDDLTAKLQAAEATIKLMKEGQP